MAEDRIKIEEYEEDFPLKLDPSELKQWIRRKVSFQPPTAFRLEKIQPPKLAPLVFRPTSWSVVSCKKDSCRYVKASYQAFGYTPSGESIYVRIPVITVYLLKYENELKVGASSELDDIFAPSLVEIDRYDRRVAVIVNPSVDLKQAEHDYIYNSTDINDINDGYIESSHRQIQNKSIIATWNKAVEAPYGSLADFFRLRKIRPYQWLAISEYQSLGKSGKFSYTLADLEITTYFNRVSAASATHQTFTRRLFWDLEVYSSTDAFPQAEIAKDSIFMASMAYSGFSQSPIETSQPKISPLAKPSTVQGGESIIEKKNRANYLLHLTKVTSINQSVGENAMLIPVSSEEALINVLLTSHRNMYIDRSYTYNGYGFDLDYVARRVNLMKYNLEPMSKIDKLRAGFVIQPYTGFFMREYGLIPLLPGTEQIDLLYYFRRFHPGLYNYKLDTVSTKFIGEGKTGLNIDELNIAYRQRDLAVLKRGAEYAMVDSILLRKLEEKLDIDQRLEALANQAGLTISQVLRLSDREIINRIVYQIMPSYYFMDKSLAPFRHKLTIKNGIYKNIYLYDFSPLYSRVLTSVPSFLTLKLGLAISVAYPKLRYMAYHLNIYQRSQLEERLTIELAKYKGQGLISMTEYLLMTNQPLAIISTRKNEPILVDKYDFFLSFTPSSYMTIEDQKITRFGRATICNPKFPYYAQLIDKYILSKLGLSNELPEVISLDATTPIDQLIGNIKIRSPASYGQRKSINSTLALQYGKDIPSWINVSWLQTTYGPMLYSIYRQIKPSSEPSLESEMTFPGSKMTLPSSKMTAPEPELKAPSSEVPLGLDLTKIDKTQLDIDYKTYADEVNKLLAIIDKLAVKYTV